MKKKLFYWLSGIVLTFLLASYLVFGFPLLVFNISSLHNINLSNNSLKKGDIIYPLQKINFKNKCSIFIIISRSDFKELPSFISRRKYYLNKVLYTNNIQIIKKIKNDFAFFYSGGDLATCESMIYVFNDNNLVFKSAIVIENESAGLQGQYGWIVAKDGKKIIDILKDFESFNFPILFL